MSKMAETTKGRVLIVGEIRCIHAIKPWRWVQQLGWNDLFVDTSCSPESDQTQGRFASHPRVRGLRPLQLLLGQKRGAAWATAIQQRRLERLLARAKPDIVHCHWIGDCAWNYSQAEVENLVLSAWGSDINMFFDGTGTPEQKAKVVATLRACRLLLADSEDTLAKAEQLAEKKLPTKLFYLGIDMGKFGQAAAEGRAEWRKKLGIPETTFLFSSVRAWLPFSNHHLILEAFAEAVKMTTRPLGLLFKVYYSIGVADQEEYEAAIRRRVEELGISDSVFWVSDVKQDELPGLYAAADAIINFPARDALPVTFFEAAASLRPVITCELPAYDIDLVHNYFYRVEAGNDAALAESMVRVVEEVGLPETAVRLEAARQIVENSYSDKTSKRILDETYHELMGR